MSRPLAIVLALGGTALAAPEASTTEVAPADLGDQGLGVELGLATGSHVTPGGMRVTGHYLYQLAAQDWFDGTASFTFGGGGAGCFRDRMDVFQCDHGRLDGNGVEIGANVRHFLGGRDRYWPFLRGGVGLGIARFPADDVTGMAIPLHFGGGMRVSVSPDVAITAQAELALGFAVFDHALGLEPQAGFVITAGAEFRL